MNEKETWLKELDIIQYQDLLTSMTSEAKDIGCHRDLGETMEARILKVALGLCKILIKHLAIGEDCSFISQPPELNNHPYSAYRSIDFSMKQEI